MKPLHNVDELLKRFNNFKGGEFRSIEIISPTIICVTLAGQDEARAFDWLSVKFEFSGVSDARLLDNSKLSLLDMDSGVSIIKETSSFAFGVGQCYNLSNIKSSTCYIEFSSMKYQEGLF